MRSQLCLRFVEEVSPWYCTVIRRTDDDLRKKVSATRSVFFSTIIVESRTFVLVLMVCRTQRVTIVNNARIAFAAPLLRRAPEAQNLYQQLHMRTRTPSYLHSSLLMPPPCHHLTVNLPQVLTCARDVRNRFTRKIHRKLSHLRKLHCCLRSCTLGRIPRFSVRNRRVGRYFARVQLV